jgi:hypothetical protein
MVSLDGHRHARQVRHQLATDSDVLHDVDRTSVTRIVVIASASRGGSSLLFHLLRSTGAFMSLSGEHSHLYKLYGLGTPVRVGHHDGSAGPPTDDVADTFSRELLRDASTGDAPAPASPRQYARDVVRRLAAQWPGALPDIVGALNLVTRHATGEAAKSRFDPVAVLLRVIADLRTAGAAIDPWYYDLPPGRVLAAFPDLPRPCGPPAVEIIEEPPFVVPVPVHPIVPDDLGRRPLLLKASVDAYRLPMLTALFPKAEIRVVHLVRNPAATINGLIDGWLSPGFFSYRLPESEATLAIEGYSHLPWGGSWWNFDLPPAWEEVIGTDLPMVCARQWARAHTSIIDDLESLQLPYLRVRAEELMSSFGAQRDIVGSLVRDLGAGAGRAPRPAPVVMATETPRPARWTSRREQIGPVLHYPDIRDTARRLGLGDAADGSWT